MKLAKRLRLLKYLVHAYVVLLAVSVWFFLFIFQFLIKKTLIFCPRFYLVYNGEVSTCSACMLCK